MKKSDVITVAFVAIIGLVVSFFIVRAIVGDPDSLSISVKTIEVVQKDVSEPSSDTFNAQALNPTVEVYVGDTTKKTDSQDNSQNNSQNNSGE